MERIIIHWTGGSHRAGELDKKHYHRLVEGDGTVVFGNEEIADNIVTSDGDYAAHTLMLNTRSIGVSMCGMRNATEVPMDFGPSPLTEVQFRAMAQLVAELCMSYGIPVTGRTVLTHAEVQPTLGVRQRGKWDLTCLKFKPELRGAIPVGDYMRELVTEALNTMQGVRAPTPHEDRATIRRGSRGLLVADAQSQLHLMAYPVGSIDGNFGSATEACVMSFQANNGLTTDGVIGRATWAKLYRAAAAGHVDPVMVGRADTTTNVVRQKGSRTILNGDRAQQGAVATVGLVIVDNVVEGLQTDPVSTIEGLAAQADRLQSIPALSRALLWFQDNWILCLAGVGACIVYTAVHNMKEARVEDTRTGKHRG
jgi:N-acetyl-anhydromuramyl-L-alanine amidase AmpD